MTKLEAWTDFARPIRGLAGDEAFILESSSHGKAFSAGWDAASKEIEDLKEIIEHLAAGAADSATYIRSLEREVRQNKDNLTVAYMRGYQKGKTIGEELLRRHKLGL